MRLLKRLWCGLTRHRWLTSGPSHGTKVATVSCTQCRESVTFVDTGSHGWAPIRDMPAGSPEYYAKEKLDGWLRATRSAA